MKRVLENWIETFEDYTETLPSPAIFKKWSAIAAVAGVLERKTWVHTLGSNLYPNLYVVLVAPPGVGKTALTSQIEKLWGCLDDQHIASSSLTKASLIDDLRLAERTVTFPKQTPPTIQFNSLKIVSNELGTLLPAYENDFMNTLTDLYDGHPYSESRRTTKTKFKLDRPQLNFLAATTPSYLNNLLPEGAWDQGFLSRTLLVYSGERFLTDLFALRADDSELFDDLKKDLIEIGRISGEMTFAPEAAAAINDWHLSGGQPAPTHPKLQHYLTRRTAHMLKLCMIASAATSSDRVIEVEHFQMALNWLMEMEVYLPDIFKSMAKGGDSKAIDECWYACFEYYIAKSAPIPKGYVVQFLAERVPAHSVDRIIEIMKQAGLLKEIQINKLGPCYKPKEYRSIN